MILGAFVWIDISVFQQLDAAGFAIARPAAIELRNFLRLLTKPALTTWKYAFSSRTDQWLLACAEYNNL